MVKIITWGNLICKSPQVWLRTLANPKVGGTPGTFSRHPGWESLPYRVRSSQPNLTPTQSYPANFRQKVTYLTLLFVITILHTFHFHANIEQKKLPSFSTFRKYILGLIQCFIDSLVNLFYITTITSERRKRVTRL